VEHGDVIKGGFASIILPKPPKLYRTEGKAWSNDGATLPTQRLLMYANLNRHVQSLNANFRVWSMEIVTGGFASIILSQAAKLYRKLDLDWILNDGATFAPLQRCLCIPICRHAIVTANFECGAWQMWYRWLLSSSFPKPPKLAQKLDRGRAWV
jgi:hypothetical protein